MQANWTTNLLFWKRTVSIPHLRLAEMNITLWKYNYVARQYFHAQCQEQYIFDDTRLATIFNLETSIYLNLS